MFPIMPLSKISNSGLMSCSTTQAESCSRKSGALTNTPPLFQFMVPASKEHISGRSFFKWARRRSLGAMPTAPEVVRLTTTSTPASAVARFMASKARVNCWVSMVGQPFSSRTWMCTTLAPAWAQATTWAAISSA